VTWRTLILAVVLGSTVDSSLLIAASNARRWREHPEQFVVEQFGVEPDPWQLEALRAFADPSKQRISLQACVGPGKTSCLAWCGWSFLACYGDRGEHPKGAAFSITWDNLKDNLWPELAKWQQRSEYLRTAFTWTKEQIFANHHPETWFLSARSWPKTASPEDLGKTLSGLHSQYVLVLGDESGAIPAAVLRAADQVLATGPVFGKIVQAGNPNSLDGMLYAAATTLRDQWTVIRITGDPDDPRAWVHAPRVGPAPASWAREQIASYGRENPWVMSQILGQFPPASINSLFAVDDVERAMTRHLSVDTYQWAQKRIGIDTSRYGDDPTVLFPRQGLVAFKPKVMRHARRDAVSTDIAAAVMAGKTSWGSELELFDGTGGWSAGALDVLRAGGVDPVDVQFHAPATDRRYKNRRAEMYFALAKWVPRGALPRVPELVRELTEQTFTYVHGQFLMEDKDQIRKRLGRSPNYSDALALTFGLPDLPAGTRLSVSSDVPTEGDDPWRWIAK
jgi:hypothetical protein